MSADADNEYFSDGLAEEIITGLSRLHNLRVVARTSAFAFKGKDLDIREIGRKLNVMAILEGSVRKSANRLRITAQLINVADGFHLWSEQYDRELREVFAIQDEIAHEIVKKLKVNLLGEDRKPAPSRIENIEMYQRFLRGRHLLTKYNLVSLFKAIDCFPGSRRIPRFHAALVGIADAFFYLGFLDLMPPRESFPRRSKWLKKRSRWTHPGQCPLTPRPDAPAPRSGLAWRREIAPPSIGPQRPELFRPLRVWDLPVGDRETG